MNKLIPIRSLPHLRVVHKLFLLLAVVIVLALGALGGLTALNLRAGFVAYINALDMERLTPLAQMIEQRSDAATGFADLHGRQAWDALLRETLGLKPPPPHPPPRPTPTTSPPSGRDHAPPVPLPPRIALLDSQRRLIAGPTPPADALLRPLRHDGVVVGWLALRPLTHPAGSDDIGFLSTQVHELSWIALALLLLALAVAWIFTRHLLAPLRGVEQGAERLASGDYQVTIETRRRDELGDLVGHINRLSAALRAHETARQRWIADISHELRTPLSIVRGEVEAMQDGVRRADDQGLRSLHEEVMRLNRLVEDLHQLSMADLGTLSYRPHRLDLATLLREACARFESAARDAGLALEQDLVSMIVHADPDRMCQLIDNLLHNSLRYTDRGGCVRVSGHRVGEFACIYVDDTTPAVGSAALPRLFEPLYRGEASRDRRNGGSGLGLAIAQRIAQAHGGELSAASSPLGGLRIELTLPAVDS